MIDLHIHIDEDPRKSFIRVNEGSIPIRDVEHYRDPAMDLEVISIRIEPIHIAMGPLKSAFIVREQKQLPPPAHGAGGGA